MAGGELLGGRSRRPPGRPGQKLRLHPLLKAPTVIIVVDRVDLDTQITGTFTAADVPNLEKAETSERLRQMLAQDVRKVIITTIFKFADAGGVLNERPIRRHGPRLQDDGAFSSAVVQHDVPGVRQAGGGMDGHHWVAPVQFILVVVRIVFGHA